MCTTAVYDIDSTTMMTIIVNKMSWQWSWHYNSSPWMKVIKNGFILSMIRECYDAAADNEVIYLLNCQKHYSEGIMSAMASQITSFTIVYSTVNSGVDETKNPSSASLAFVREIHRLPGHKGSVTRKMFPFDDLINIFGRKGFGRENALNSFMRYQWKGSTKLHSR